MSIPLQPPKQVQSPDDHMQISRRFLEHARDELSKGERLQASEKVYGAAQHALASIGKERGWRTERSNQKRDIVNHLAEEYSEPHIVTLHDSFEPYHLNFHDNQLDEGNIGIAISAAETFVDEIQRLREAEPRPFTVTADYQAKRIQRMTGSRAEIGNTDAAGFVNPDRLARNRRRWSDEDDDGEAGSPAILPPDNPPAGGGAGVLPPGE